MVFGAALAAFLSVQSDSALERLQLLMSSSKAFEFKCHAQVNDGPSMPCVAKWQNGVDQQFQVGSTFEMRQTDEALVLTDHTDKTYQEYRGFPFPAAPDAKFYFNETLAYPWFFVDFANTYRGMKPEDWVSQPAGDGVLLRGRWVSGMSAEDVELTVNKQGIPSKIVRTIKMEKETFVITHLVDSLTGIPPFGTPSLLPSAGYLPSGLTNFFTPTPGDKVKKLPLHEASGRVSDLSAIMGKNGVTILFTAPDCAVSRASSAELAALKAELDRAGYPLVEVSLGSEKPAASCTGARQFVDAGQAMERHWAIPTTPYLLSINKQDIVVGAWEGWWKGCLHKALESLTTADPD